MQKQSMFQAFMKKKYLIAQMIADSKSMGVRNEFKHFQALSQPVYIKAESNAIYLTHLNSEFKDQLKEFVRQQESFNETIFQLAKVTESFLSEKDGLEATHRGLKNKLNDAELEKQVMSDKNKFQLDKILTLQDQEKSIQVMEEQHERIATQLEEDIEFEKCILQQIKKKNSELIEKLQLKTVEIQESTLRMETSQKQIRQKQSAIKKMNQQIKNVYFTLEAQDDSLAGMCSAIQQSLNKQNDRINDIQFAKNNLLNVLGETQTRKKQLKQSHQTQQRFLNYWEDLQFDLRRTTKQLQIEQKGVDQEYWKIQQEKQRIQQNHLMLYQLQQYLQDLVYKNHLLEQSLEEQIVQDHTIKKIFDTKCNQPVGLKTKILLQQIQSKELVETSGSWTIGKENQFGQFTSSKNVRNAISPHQKRKFIQKQVDIAARISPQQIDFVFQKFFRASRQYDADYKSQQAVEDDDKYISSGLTYIDKLTKIDNQM